MDLYDKKYAAWYDNHPSLLPIHSINEFSEVVQSLLYDTERVKSVVSQLDDLVKKNCYKFDGKSSERVARVILKNLKKKNGKKKNK